MKINSLKFLTDENVSPKVVSYLREKGVDVIDVKEKGWHGTEDKFLMGIGSSEKRFILTHDSDFGTLAIGEGFPCYGIIYLRLKDLRVENVKRIMQKLFVMETDIPERSMIVVEEKRLRIRGMVQQR
jgi:predicted nuclease of predicted toxin-antitoxin system